MARQSIKVTIGSAFGEGRLTPDANQTGVGLNAATMVADAIPVAAALAVLVADAASPTQAHVTTLNNAYTTLAADIAALNVAITGDVQITWDTTKVTTITQLKRAFDAALQAAAGGGILTA